MEHLDKIQSNLAPQLAAMNQIISTTLLTSNEMMNGIVTSYLQQKGKQIRPILVIISAEMFGEINDNTLYAGASLEMLHNASLIHDDIVDETMLRRGVPTINSMWGNHLAVLVGDYFVSKALSVGIRTGKTTIVASLSELGEELSLGEVDQICNVREHHFDEESYISMISKKTASLFMNCVKMGAESVNAPAETYAPMIEFARLLGLCFQIKDDIFDYYADPQIGKPTGNDLREGKVTLPLLYALNHAQEGEEMKQLIMRGDLNSEEIALLIDFAKQNGGIEYAYERMRQMQVEAEKILAKYPDSQAKENFRIIFDYIISRNK